MVEAEVKNLQSIVQELRTEVGTLEKELIEKAIHFTEMEEENLRLTGITSRLQEERTKLQSEVRNVKCR